MTSLRRRLLLGVGMGTVVVWLLMAVTSYVLESRRLHTEFDVQLSKAADLLQDIVQLRAGSDHLLAALPASAANLAPPADSQAFYQLLVDGQLRLRSNGAPLQPVKMGGKTLTTLKLSDSDWRVLSRPVGNIRIVVAEKVARRWALAQIGALRRIWPLLLFVPLLLAAGAWAIQRALAPVRHLSQQVARRGPDALQPLHADETPAELRPLTDALNALLYRVQAALERERSFTANAAHELRTPLAAIRSQVEVAQVADGAVQRRALGQVLAAVQRSTRLIDQLLLLARIENDDGLQDSVVDAGGLAEEIVAELSDKAQEAGVQVQLQRPDAVVHIHAGGVHIALGNLLRNALRYAPAGSQIQVRVVHKQAWVFLEVEDQGPGMPADLMSQASQRFFRAPDAVGLGSGLGLAIVERVASLHGGKLKLLRGSNQQGLCARLRLPYVESKQAG